jgi:hypothetical protein
MLRELATDSKWSGQDLSPDLSDSKVMKLPQV